MGKTKVSLMAEVPAASIEKEQGLIHIFPFGEFAARDGRPGNLDVPAKTWKFTPECAEEVLRRWEERKTPLVVDYEHQTYETHENGQPAPAAGWIGRLEIRENGLFATVEWTPRAKEYIRSGEYKYISPTFLFDPQTGLILELYSAALTNNPALDGMEPVKAKSNATQKILAFEGQRRASARRDKRQPSFIDQKKNRVQPEVVQMLREAQETIASLTKRVQAYESKEEAAKLTWSIDQALQDGRLQPSCEAWARACAVSYPEALRSFLDASSPLAALISMQTRGRGSKNLDGIATLSTEENHVRSQLGMSVETFIKHKKECQ